MARSYLLEQEGSEERFVHRCSVCRHILQVRHETTETIESLDVSCPGCGSRPEDGAGRRMARVLGGWPDVQSGESVSLQRRAVPFISAASLPHFSLGIPRLDLLIGPLSSRSLVALSGGASSTVAELMAFRAQLPVEAGGLDSSVVFVDGGNRSDPYLFSSFAKQHGSKPAVAMREVATYRVFTIYQLADLVSKHLFRAAEDYAAKLVVISGLLDCFNEPELDEREARRLLRAIEDGIGRVKNDSLVLATLAAPNKHDEEVTRWADVAVSMTSFGDRVQAELTKHPTRPLKACSLTPSQLLKPFSAAVAR